MANQYLSEELDAPAIGSTVILQGPDARHAVTVSRLAVGETVTVGNGAGVTASGTVTEVAPAEFRFTVESVITQERQHPMITLVQALAKGGRDEMAVQAATELGVDRIIPWGAARSIARWDGDKAGKGRQRWTSIVREATKQSARAWLPEVAEIVTTKQLATLAAGNSGEQLMVVLDPLAEHSLVELAPTPIDLLLVVGPEGGIAADELSTLLAAGAVGARLGTNILRTSTAGPAALAVLSAKLGRW
ncbi:MAG TPA: 16S rRNA (uracil(1498)-N(3))-methyltransferase [Galbitalea sp.]|jgi:16S rRNA (uracil1498-N3)-methyltransferase|nr:16S rRNA (uracil(1498)-N(3))-methyltransferase [Galbitalea sp.]